MEQYLFYPETHKYSKKGDKKKGVSVTGVIGKYHETFDSSYWTKYKAWESALCEGTPDEKKICFRQIRKDIGFMKVKDKKLFSLLAKKYPHIHIEDDIIQEAKNIDKEWTSINLKSQVDGTAIHDSNEKSSIQRGWELNPWDNKRYPVIIPYKWDKGIKVSTVDLLNLKPGYYPEIIVYFDGIFGQIDRLWVGDNRRFWIRDFKSNKKIDTSNRFQMMKYPINYIEDCNYNHYRLQLSLYAWILINLGYKLQGLGIDHHNQPYNFDYLKKEVELIILDWKIDQYNI